MNVIDNAYIIDASIVLAWLLPDELYKQSANNILELYRQKKTELIAPTLLPYEIVNGIKTSVLRKRINEETADEIIQNYKALDIKLFEPNEENILHIAITHKISAYDSAYVSLLISRKKSLITADKKLFKNLQENRIKNTIWITDFK